MHVCEQHQYVNIEIFYNSLLWIFVTAYEQCISCKHVWSTHCEASLLTFMVRNLKPCFCMLCLPFYVSLFGKSSLEIICHENQMHRFLLTNICIVESCEEWSIKQSCLIIIFSLYLSVLTTDGLWSKLQEIFHIVPCTNKSFDHELQSYLFTF